MRLEQLKYILTIDEYKSINKAAQKLYISPQTLCASLNTLEDELGFYIFARTSKGVILTYQGKKIIDDIAKIVQTITNWQQVGSEAINEIHIAAANVCVAVLTELITETKTYFPNCTIYLKCIPSNIFFLKEDITLEDDIFISPVPIEYKKRMYETINMKSCSITELGFDTSQLIVNANNPLAQKDFVDLADLFEQEFVVYQNSPKDNFIGEDLVKYFKKGVSCFFNNKEQMYRMIANNNAVSIGVNLDRYENHYFKNGELKMLPINGYVKDSVYVLSYPNKKARSSEEEFVLEKVITSFNELQQKGIINKVL